MVKKIRFIDAIGICPRCESRLDPEGFEGYQYWKCKKCGLEINCKGTSYPSMKELWKKYKGVVF